MSDADAYNERKPKKSKKVKAASLTENLRLHRQNQTLKQELREMEASFNLRWKADMRATERWRKAGPDRDLTLPDHADLVCWLMSRLAATEKTNATLREKLQTSRQSRHALRLALIADEN
jgi:hypothetical protein